MGRLYHYTSVSGFDGIIRSNSIRMTRSEFLNDPYDCHLFIKLVEKYLAEKQTLVKETISNLGKCRKDVEKLYYEADYFIHCIHIYYNDVHICTEFKFFSNNKSQR